MVGENQRARFDVVVITWPFFQPEFRFQACVLFLKLMKRVMSPIWIPTGVFHGAVASTVWLDDVCRMPCRANVCISCCHERSNSGRRCHTKGLFDSMTRLALGH